MIERLAVGARFFREYVHGGAPQPAAIQLLV